MGEHGNDIEICNVMFAVYTKEHNILIPLSSSNRLIPFKEMFQCFIMPHFDLKTYYVIYSSKKETHSEILGRYRNKPISSKAMFN